jgi:hypothetical protein
MARQHHNTPRHDESCHGTKHLNPTTIHEFLALPSYALASRLQYESQHPDGGDFPLILDMLANQNPYRAALALADLSGMALNKNLSEHYDPAARKFAALLSRCELLPLIHDAMLLLPTLDAILARRVFMNVRDTRFLDITAAAMYAVMRPNHHEKAPLQIGAASYSLPDGFLMPNRDAGLHARYSKMADELCEPVSQHPSLSPHNQQLLSLFRDELAPKLFPIQRYGYGSISDVLEISQISPDRWAFKNPWGETPDAPSPFCHQCADSASAARSFFVSHGVPADVYSMSVGSTFHNVCVAFFQEQRPTGMKFIPTLVDASPYNGFYQVSDRNQTNYASFRNPISTCDVFNQRKASVPFVEAEGFSLATTGLAPWFCEDLPSGRARIIGFGGVMANQKSWWPERGTPEYYGHGIRAPRPEVSLHIIPRTGDPLESLVTRKGCIHLSFHSALGEAVLHGHVPTEQIENESFAQLRAELLREVQSIAARHLQAVTALVERSGYSLEERVYR